MSLTSISLLDRTHLYEKFAVQVEYHSAFTVAYLGASVRFTTHFQLHGSCQFAYL